MTSNDGCGRMRRGRLAAFFFVALCAVVVGGWCAPTRGAAQEPAAPTVDLARIHAGGEPSTLAELKAMEQHQQQLAERVSACTVGIVVGPAHGSGVIVSADGLVLTAAHVVGKPKQTAAIILPDGQTVRGVTLGVYRTLDAGLVKITPRGNWPHAEMAKGADEVRVGQWCVATGHPGGYESDRKPVVRIGRVLLKDKFAITTDCTLVGGDSGGPLFDMDGRVIGIHSRIGRFLTANMHVPIAAYEEAWDRLVQGDAWGHLPGSGPVIGVEGDSGADAAKVARVFPGSPAEKAGLKAGDVVVNFGDKAVADFAQLQACVADSDPGDKVNIEVLRDGARLQLKLVIGRQGRIKDE